jgi:hypothetical protein
MYFRDPYDLNPSCFFKIEHTRTRAPFQLPHDKAVNHDKRQDRGRAKMKWKAPVSRKQFTSVAV